jgi:phage terminase small subunit
MRRLTQREENFIDHYREHGNATEAAIAAGYSPHSARDTGCQMLKREQIKDALEKIRKHNAYKSVLSIEKVERSLAAMAHADPLGLVWKPGELDSNGQSTHPGEHKPMYELAPDIRQAIKKMVCRSFERADGTRGNEVHVEFWDKVKANELIMNRLGMLQQKSDINGNAVDLVKTVVDAIESAKNSGIITPLQIEGPKDQEQLPS